MADAINGDGAASANVVASASSECRSSFAENASGSWYKEKTPDRIVVNIDAVDDL